MEEKTYKVLGYHREGKNVEEKSFSVFIDAVKYYMQLVGTSELISAALIELNETDKNDGKILEFYSERTKE